MQQLEEQRTALRDAETRRQGLLERIAKGQGNFETLHGSGRNIFYLFLCKCELFTSKFQTERFTPVLNNELRIVQSA